MSSSYEPDGIAAARRALGRQLAALRQSTGHSQAEFAPLTGYGRSTLANVETGRQNVPREFWVRCEEHLGTCELVAAYDEIRTMVAAERQAASRRSRAERESHIRAWQESAVAGWPPYQDPGHLRRSPAPPSRRASVTVTEIEGENADVRRRDFIALTGVTITAPDALRAIAAEGTTGTPQHTGRVDEETYDGLASLMLGYRQIYRSASAASLLGPVRGTLTLLTELTPDSGPYRRRMVSLIGQAATLTGAIYMFDLGDFASAKYYLAIGSRAAQQSEDTELLAIALACRAFHATYSGAPQVGEQFARGALKEASGGIRPRSHAWVAAVASEMHATLGPAGEAACMTSLETARKQLALPMPERPWAGIGAFDDGKLAAYHGGDLMRLGRYNAAQTQLQAALRRLGTSLVKHRCTAHIDLAEAYDLDNEPAQAARHAIDALDITACTGHADSLRRIQHVYASVRGSDVAEARELGSRLLELDAVSVS